MADNKYWEDSQEALEFLYHKCSINGNDFCGGDFLSQDKLMSAYSIIREKIIELCNTCESLEKKLKSKLEIANWIPLEPPKDEDNAVD